MGYDCAFALRGSGALVSVCGYAEMGKYCVLALLGLVLVFIPVVAQRQLPWFAYSADHRDCPVADHWQSVRRLGCARSAGSSGGDVEKTVESPQLQLVEVPGVDYDMPVVVQRQVLVST